MDYEAILDDLQAAALKSHQQEDDITAFDTLEDMLALGERVGAYRTLLAALTQEMAVEDVCTTLEEILPEVQPAADNVHAGSRGAIPRERIATLAQELLDERSLREAIVKAMQAERCWGLEAVRMMASGQAGNLTGRSSRWSLGTLMFGPMFRLDGVHILRYSTGLVEVARADSLPEITRARRT